MREIVVVGATIRPTASHATAEAVLIRDRSVVAVGTRTDCLNQVLGVPEILDLSGYTVLPGFVDAHCHPLMYGQFRTWVACDWRAAPAIADVVRLLSARSCEVPGPVRGRGFHHGNVADRRMLNRHDLDQVAHDREVVVFHSSGHGAFVNSWTLTARGITARTPDPVGGHFGREPDGTPDGSLWDAAADWLTGDDGVKIGNSGPNFHLEDPEAELDRQFDAGQRGLLAQGITTAVDAQVTAREMSTYLRAHRNGRLHLRAELLLISSLLDELEHLGISDRFGDDHLGIAGVKLYADGALTAGTARWSEPYCSHPADIGYLYHEPGELAQLIERVHGLGLVAATHAQGDAAIEIVLDAFSRLGPSRVRHRIEHFGGPTQAQVARTAALGLWPVPQPQYLVHYGDELRGSLGERAARVYPLGEMRDAGIPIVLSSDAPVCPPGPMEAVSAAVNRRTASGHTLGTTGQRLTVVEALVAHTLTAAASIGREHRIGSLQVGKQADFVVLTADPVTRPSESVADIEVAETWVGGERVFGRDTPEANV